MFVFMSMLVSHVSLRFIVLPFAFSYTHAYVESENQAGILDQVCIKEQ